MKRKHNRPEGDDTNDDGQNTGGGEPQGQEEGEKKPGQQGSDKEAGRAF